MRSEAPLLSLRRVLVDVSGESPVGFAVAAGGIALLLAGTLQAFEPELGRAYQRVSLAFAVDQASAADDPVATAAIARETRQRVSPRLYGKDKYLREYN